jgi:serine/threonine protein kinase
MIVDQPEGPVPGTSTPVACHSAASANVGSVAMGRSSLRMPQHYLLDLGDASVRRFAGEGDQGRRFEVLWEDGERMFGRGWRLDDNGSWRAVLVILPLDPHPSRASLDRLAHEVHLKDELDGPWAVRPLELLRDGARAMLVLEDIGGFEPLTQRLTSPLEMGNFLNLAVEIASAISKLHQRGLVHKDIKPANMLVNSTTGEVKLTGFGIASRLPRERQAPDPPETIAGTLAYMAPEQTGRMNRSIDHRSDLYALGVTLYQMLTGSLPFSASDPVEWVHCHIARHPMAPAERLKDVPGTISAITMKLLAKTAEERYQSAGGVERDLRRCLAEWEAKGHIDDFPLGEHDRPDRLLIPRSSTGERARSRLCSLRSIESSRAGRRSSCWFPVIPGLASPPSSTNYTRRLCRRADSSPPANSTSISAISHMRPYRGRFRGSSCHFLAKAKPSWRRGVTRFSKGWGRTVSSWSILFRS